MAKKQQPEDFYFEGFDNPNTTPVPDVVFDVLAPEMTEAELRVLLYIIRRTYGFKKNSDSISINQMIQGITTRDGRTLDKGTGMSRQGVMRGIKGLLEKGVIEVRKSMSEDGVNQINLYSLRFREEGVVYEGDYGRSRSRPGVVHEVDPQETVEQQTVKQETDISNIRRVDTLNFQERVRERHGAATPPAPPAKGGPVAVGTMLPARRGRLPKGQSEARQMIAAYLDDFAREFNDQAPLKSSVTRAENLMRTAGVSADAFQQALFEARAITKEQSGGIRASVKNKQSAWPQKNKMAYFFSVLEDLLGLREPVAAEHAPPPEPPRRGEPDDRGSRPGTLDPAKYRAWRPRAAGTDE